ncbi:hypothetical protein [Tessaracoccus oleiagri]|nr:hypothetical protein [Tessaracoccus oleiagri]
MTDQLVHVVSVSSAQKPPSILDRVALRVGLWLIQWGTGRPTAARDGLANRELLDRELRERRYQQRLDLHRPY